MNKIIFIAKFWLVSALMCASVAQAQDNAQLLNRIANISAKPEAMQANFKQSKKINGFRAPVVSSGKVVLVRQRGMLWFTQAPYQSSLHITANGIVEKQGGQSTQIANAQGMKNMTQIMSAMLSGNFSGLNQYFNFSGTAQAKSWALHLTPLDEHMRRSISNIDLSGGQFVNRAVIYEVSGDVTTIVFSQAHPISSNNAGF